MRPPGFWWRDRPGPLAAVLWPASLAWGAIVERRMRRAAPFRAPIPVVCIGNYTAGGEGKTPTAIALGELAIAEGLRPGFLTRGYGGRERGPVVVEDHHGADTVGDEALLLATTGTTVVSHDRAAGARLLVETDVEIIIMDDGFQNPGLAKDLSLVVTDAGTGLGNRLVIPAGPLRAPLSAQLRRTDALVVIGAGEAEGPLARLAARSGRRLLRARLLPEAPEDWAGATVLAFAGIGRPEKFFATLQAAGAKFAGRVAFADHHVLTEDEARSLLAHAGGGDIRLVTTEKDMARLKGSAGACAELRAKAEIFRVRLVFEDTDAIRQLLRGAVDQVRVGRRPSAAAR